MNVDAALTVFGLTKDATPVDVGETYRKIRKPLLKELNKYDDDQQPAELVEQLDAVDTAYKVLQTEIKPAPRESTLKTGSTSTKRHTGRVSFARGDVLAGRFEIEALIAHRPEGDTYRVKDKVRGVSLGMKVIAPALLQDARGRARMLRGLTTATRLNHPHLARVLDIHPMQQTYAVTLEIPADAENLWDLMYGAEGKRERLTPDLVLRLTQQATHALAYLQTVMPHAALRPESVWITPDGNVKIADFGFSDVQQALRERRLSRTKLGTAYWAPEQYSGDASADGRSDEYSLALILYEILSGKPAVGRTQKIRGLRKDYPQRFTDALERGLSSKPGRRFATMDEFGDAAFAGYRAEGMVPAGSRESMLIPTLILLAVFAGLAFSPIGRAVADRLGSAVANWQRTEADVASADRDLRQLRAMSARLGRREEALDENSKQELAKARTALDASDLDASARAAINDDLAEIVRKLVADSYRGAEKRMGAYASAMAALDAHGTDGIQTTGAALAGLVRDFDPDAAFEERSDGLLRLVRLQASRARAEDAWRAARARVRALPERAVALRALLEAEAALAIGDETATDGAYERAARALETIETGARAATEALPEFTLEFPPKDGLRTWTAVEGDDREKLLAALLEPASDLAADADLARVLAGLRGDAIEAADVNWLVHDDGYWALTVSVGARSFLLCGTWTGSEAQQRLRVGVFGNRLLESPYELAATRGGERPGLGDLRQALATGPRDTSAWWSVRRGGAEPLPSVTFLPAERTVGTGEVTISGTLAEGAPGCVLVDARRFDLDARAFEARVDIPGNVLGTWVRAHAARGMRSGPAGWVRLKSDVLEPRIQLLEPAPGTPLDGDKPVKVRALVYDSNLATIEVAGKPYDHDARAVYVLVEQELTTPARGTLTVPVRAVDAAGNEKALNLEWPIR